MQNLAKILLILFLVLPASSLPADVLVDGRILVQRVGLVANARGEKLRQLATARVDSLLLGAKNLIVDPQYPTANLISDLFAIMQQNQYLASRYAILGIDLALRNKNPGDVEVPAQFLSYLKGRKQLKPADVLATDRDAVKLMNQAAEDLLRHLGVFDLYTIESQLTRYNPLYSLEIAQSVANLAWQHDYIDEAGRGPTMAQAFLTGLNLRAVDATEALAFKSALLQSILALSAATPNRSNPAWVYESDALLEKIANLAFGNNNQLSPLALQILQSRIAPEGIHLESRFLELPLFFNFFRSRLTSDHWKTRQDILIGMTNLTKASKASWLISWSEIIGLAFENLLHPRDEVRKAALNFILKRTQRQMFRARSLFTTSAMFSATRILNAETDLEHKVLAANWISSCPNNNLDPDTELALINFLSSHLDFEKRETILGQIAKKFLSSPDQIPEVIEVALKSTDAKLVHLVAQLVFRAIGSSQGKFSNREAVVAGLLKLVTYHADDQLLVNSARRAISEVRGQIWWGSTMEYYASSCGLRISKRTKQAPVVEPRDETYLD